MVTKPALTPPRKSTNIPHPDGPGCAVFRSAWHTCPGRRRQGGLRV